jgi:prevent-host-death family protein
MHFRSDEIQPFYEVRQSLSKTIDEMERSGGEIVIAKHGKPVAALLSAAGLYRYREIDRLMGELLAVLNAQAQSPDAAPLQASFAALYEQAKPFLVKPSERQS